MSFQAGVFYFDYRPVPKSESDSILDSLASPDYGHPASWCAPGIFMGQAGFRTCERTASHPYATNAGAITFDGRLDNGEDLRLSLGDPLRGECSDSALALATYDKWGKMGLARLIGDWSLTIWDPARHHLTLASDYAGPRPLYYWCSPSCIRWSTRLKALVQWAKATEIDDDYVAGYLLYGACPNRTPFRGVASIPPGHCLTISTQGIEVQRFWRIPMGDVIRYQHESDYEDRVLELFADAVGSRLQVSTSVLAELGGLDSSSVVGMANHLIRTTRTEARRLVTVTYERQGSLDIPFCRAVETHCGIESIHLSTADHVFIAETNVGDAVPAFWESLHTEVASIARRLGTKTLLTGSMGDLVMGNLWDDSDQVSGLLRSGDFRGAFSQALEWSKVLRTPIARILWRNILLASSIPAVATPEWSWEAYSAGNDSISSVFRNRMQLDDPDRFLSTAWKDAPPERRQYFRGVAQMLELRKFQPSERLAHLEYTHPYTHRPLLTFLLSIPVGVLCGPGERRRLMRRAFHPLWPPSLKSRRSKDSFGGVFNQALQPIAVKLLRDTGRLQVVERGYIEASHLRTRLEQCTHSLECNQPQLRLIILLELWLRRQPNLL